MINTESLRENHIFRASYRHGKQHVCKTMAVYVMKNRRKTVNQLGITVSVKLGCAVVRNRCRRRLKEAFRLIEPQLRPGHVIVLVARSASVSADFKNICADMSKAFSELNIL